MKKVHIHKIGGAGLMLARQELLLLIEKIFLLVDNSELIFVVSAFSKVTRTLDDIFNEMVKGNLPKANEFFDEFKEIHFHRIKDFEIEIPFQIEKYFSEIDTLIQKGIADENKFRFQANLLKYGELCSSLIFTEFFKKNYSSLYPTLIDARTFMVGMGSDYVQAEILQPDTVEKINIVFAANNSSPIITQGYIASNLAGRDMVLGYDGSDLTAAIITLSFLMLKPNHHVSLTYWKDILGVYKNPRNRKDTVIFHSMKLREYLEFAVDHSVPVREDSLEILSKFSPKRLEIYIRSFLNLEDTGTIISPYPF